MPQDVNLAQPLANLNPGVNSVRVGLYPSRCFVVLDHGRDALAHALAH